MYQSEVRLLNLQGESLFTCFHILKYTEASTYGTAHVSERVAQTVWYLSPILHCLILVLSFLLF